MYSTDYNIVCRVLLYCIAGKSVFVFGGGTGREVGLEVLSHLPLTLFGINV